MAISNKLKVGAAGVALAAAAVVVPTAASSSYPMDPPSGLVTSAATHDSLTLAWKPVKAAPRYRVQISKKSSMSGAKFYRSAGPETSRTITGLSKNTTYYVKVRVITENGENLSKYSSAYKTKTAKFSLAPPFDVLADTITKDSAVIRWDAMTGAPMYRVKISTVPEMTNPKYYYTEGNKPERKITGLNPSTTYYVQARVVKTDQATELSDYSAPHPFLTLDEDVTPPPPPDPTDPPDSNGTVNKVLVFWLENKSFSQVKKSMPFTYGLGKQYGIATNHKARTHPSLPNYIAMAFGSTQGVSSNIFPDSKKITAPTVFGEAVKNGRTAKTYADGMPSNCYLKNGGTHYAPRHNPHTYADSEVALCKKINVPYASNFSGDAASGNFPNVGMVIPNNCNNAHDCSMATADKWNKARWEIIQKSPDWKSGKLLVIFTADEDNKTEGNRVFTAMIHPSLKGKTVDTPLTHYSFSRLLSQVGHSTPLLNGKSATDVAKAFGLKVE
jgi:hypothetical protein